MIVTVLQYLRLHKWFTFSALGDKRSAEKIYAFNDCHIYEYDFLGIVNDYNGFTTSKIALTFTFSAHGESPGAAGDRGKLE